jgi:hypothetical protein
MSCRQESRTDGREELRLLYLYFEEEGGLNPVVVLQR